MGLRPDGRPTDLRDQEFAEKNDGMGFSHLIRRRPKSEKEWFVGRDWPAVDNPQLRPKMKLVDLAAWKSGISLESDTEDSLNEVC